MFDAITNNPYRVLGVFANAPTKERVANASKLKAFLKVGKQLSFPCDLPTILPPITRTPEMIAEAENRLALPDEQIKHAQFWFVSGDETDVRCFKALNEGHFETATKVWPERKTVSALQNTIVLAAIHGIYELMFRAAKDLYIGEHDLDEHEPNLFENEIDIFKVRQPDLFPDMRTQQFVEMIAGPDVSITAETLAHNFLDTLCANVDARRFLNQIGNAEWEGYVRKHAAAPSIEQLNAAIEIAKRPGKDDPQACMRAGQKLMAEADKLLKQILDYLSKYDLQYKLIADKAALQVLDCAISYYNNTHGEAARISLPLYQWAAQTAVGEQARKRCIDNLHIMEENVAALPPKELVELADLLNTYCKKENDIAVAMELLQRARPLLLTLRQNTDKDDEAYLVISTNIVSLALGKVVRTINDTQVKSLNILREAEKAMQLMASFDMAPDFRSKQYDTNLKTLRGMIFDREHNFVKVLDDIYRERKPTQTDKSKAKDENRSFRIAISTLLVIITVSLCANFCSNCSDNKEKAAVVNTDSIDAAVAAADSAALADSLAAAMYASEQDEWIERARAEQERVFAERMLAFTEAEAREAERQRLLNNRLKTGSKPYAAYYGYGTTGDNEVKVKTTSGADVIVLAKSGFDGSVVNHIYIRGGSTGVLSLPDGDYNIYFYCGKGWDPNKRKTHVVGGFVENENTTKDTGLTLKNNVVTYTLQLTTNGNFSPQHAKESEVL